ncbi:MAG TPA: cell division protein FtsL [Burkholderiaceae bacterium]|jgi:cell division protein FtsL|nr:cell division protein FtsL [Burkholderiaceae bacterium]
MIRLNLVLLLAVLVSAFYLVHVQYDSRRLYTALDRMRAQAQRLEADHEQLVVQKRAQATPGRVQQIATGQLQMRPANPAITEYVKAAPVALPAPSTPPAAEARE